MNCTSTSDSFLLDGQVKYSLYPDRFYGIGNRNPETNRESYSSRNWRLQMNMQRRWGSSLFAGLHLDYYSLQVMDAAKGGLLAAGDIPGSRGGTLSALGLFAKWDSRDNTFSASSGSYCALFLNFFSPVLLASDFNFTPDDPGRQEIFSPGPGPGAGRAGGFQSGMGRLPFPGPAHVRGLEPACAASMKAATATATCWPCRPNTAARYGGASASAASPGWPRCRTRSRAWRSGEFHVAGGAGLRYKFNRRENLSVRLDLGFAGPSPAFYLTFAEAF